MIFDGRSDRPWKPEGPRPSELVSSVVIWTSLSYVRAFGLACRED